MFLASPSAIFCSHFYMHPHPFWCEITLQQMIVQEDKSHQLNFIRIFLLTLILWRFGGCDS